MNNEEKLIQVIGLNFNKWKERYVVDDMSFNPIATALDYSVWRIKEL